MAGHRLFAFLLGLLAAPLGAAAAEPFASRYQIPDSPLVILANARILIGDGRAIDSGYVVMEGGEITEVGSGDYDGSRRSAEYIDLQGQWVTPGLIDNHSHLGVYASPGYAAHSDGNEATAPVTAEVWAEHSVWPQDPQFPLALAGGVTAMQVLPGSANLFGGRSVTLKNVSARNVMEMKFPGAPHGLKMACGENPKRVYGGRNSSPATRMGNVAGYRAAWIKAQNYQRQWQEYDGLGRKEKADKPPPERNLQLETLVGVLDGKILVHNHCYRADEMSVMIEIGKEFGYGIAAFHHGVEAYKIADLLRENDICSAVWADWWRFKMESFDGIKENIALLEKAGACVVLHSDSALGIQRLNQEAAKALAAAQRLGLDFDEATAIKWITANPARSMGILDQTGTLEEGKMADLVVWSGNPFSVYAKAEQVYIDGVRRYDRSEGLKPVTDFELGQREDEL